MADPVRIPWMEIMPIPRLRKYQGPALLSYGFRPFFLFAALYSGFSILLWLPQFYGELQLATLFAPVDWHIHEMYFGFLAAVITGFLFTAVPNWTGRMPLQGTPLLFLLLIWLAGRIAVTFSAAIGWVPAMAVDLAFLAAIIGTEIAAGKNWRNLKVLVPLGLLLVANAAFHLEAHYTGASDVSRRLALAAAITLITLIGGRIIPSFTRNWLVRENPGRLPVPFDRFDIIALTAGIAALGVWIARPEGIAAGVLMALAAVLHLVRLSRWAGDRTLRDPLVAVLHAGYLFIPAGFGLLAWSILWPDAAPQIAGIHALGAGAIGTMTLAVMVRATLGHTGQALKASWATQLLFVSVIAAVLARIAASFRNTKLS